MIAMTDTTKTSQCDKILADMQEFGSITPLDAIREFSCLRLGARIWDLKQKGYKIRTDFESAKNRYGDTVHYARYTLLEGEMEDDGTDYISN